MNVARAVLPLFLWGCTFSVSGIEVGDDAAAPDLGPIDLGIVDGPPPDMADAATICDPHGANNGCAADQLSLLSCRPDGSGFNSQLCAFGCGTPGGTARCLNLEPSGVAQASDYAIASAMPTITSNVVFNTDDGSITGGLTRSAGAGVRNGIFFRQATQTGGPGVAVFGFAGLNVAQGVVIRAQGSSAIALVSSRDVTIAGSFNLQDDCTGPVRAAGAAVGGSGSTMPNGDGAGGGVGGAVDIGGKSSGGGGGGHGDVGGSGGATMLKGGAGGQLFGELTIEPVVLSGGGGGGAGGAGGAGGNGGGAIQVAVNGKLTLGGTIHAGGCGGLQGGPAGSGGGGGAGGAILIEAATVVLANGSVVTANGGGGGGAGAGSGQGANGAASASAAPGGVGGGGAGGAKGATAGQAAPAASKLSGGGGGGVGRVAIKTLDGTITNQGALLSPDLSDLNAAGKAPAAVALANFQ